MNDLKPYEVIITGAAAKKDAKDEILYGPETFMAVSETTARYVGILNMAKDMGLAKVLKDIDILSLSVKAKPF